MKIVNKSNPFPVSLPILHPVRAPKMLCFTGIFRGYRMRTSTRNGLKAFDRVGHVGLPHKLKFYYIFLEVVLPYFVFS